MMNVVEHRKARRYSRRVTALLEDPLSGYLAYAQMVNFSSDGMCFESDFAFEPGTKLVIHLAKSLFAGCGRIYHALLVWSKERNGDDCQYPYEAGFLLLNSKNR